MNKHIRKPRNEEMYKAILSLETVEECMNFFDDLCTVTELQAIIDLPLQIDTASPEAMEKAMRIYNGKPLVNSVNGKAEVMAQIFPLVKKYGGLLIALTLDENGIPTGITAGTYRVSWSVVGDKNHENGNSACYKRKR